MAKHALLSASGAHRWLECTPSALLELQFPQTTSEYAEEGTAAHELCELTARYFLGEVSEMDFENRRDELAKGPYCTCVKCCGIILKNCLTKGGILAKFDADAETLDEELEGTFDDWEMPETFSLLNGMQ